MTTLTVLFSHRIIFIIVISVPVALIGTSVVVIRKLFKSSRSDTLIYVRRSRQDAKGSSDSCAIYKSRH
jgi:hypothetical protein